MTTDTLDALETNRALALKFNEAWNTRNFDLFEEILHPEFTWQTAITPPGVSEIPPHQSEMLKATPQLWTKAINSREETLAIFKGLLDATPHFTITVTSVTADDDRVAVEGTGSATHPENGRSYDNSYCYVFTIRDGQLFSLREYQNTLLVFDVFVAQ